MAGAGRNGYDLMGLYRCRVRDILFSAISLTGDEQQYW